MTGLTASDFQVFEEGLPIEFARTEQVLLDRELAVATHTLVLVDHSAATDKNVRDELAAAVSILLEQLRPTQAVSVFAYDGAAELRHIGEFPRSPDSPKQDVGALRKLQPRDTSRNLNGALLRGGEELDARLAQYQQPLKAGTLVIFAGGPDLAGRADPASVHRFLRETPLNVITIGFGDGSARVRDIGKSGFFDAHSVDTLSLAFEEAAHRIRGLHEGSYLFAYCSPARGGKRQLRIDARLPESAADAESEPGTAPKAARTGSAYGEFTAEGFRSGCKSGATPKFGKR